MNLKVDEYINKSKWQEEYKKLRKILLDSSLIEEFKWGIPCYTVNDNNILLMGGFKEYLTLSFFKGSLLKDNKKILIKPGENTQVARIIKFTDTQQIEELENIIKDYIHEAIEIEKSGLKGEFKDVSEFKVTEELQIKFNEMPDLKIAFEKLTPGRQKGYLLHFSEPKQSKTRESRIDKYIPLILSGKGLKDCTCGLSKRMPVCDGSHKPLKQ